MGDGWWSRGWPGRLALFGVVAALALSGCGGDADPDAAPDVAASADADEELPEDAEFPEIDFSHRFPARVRAEVTGAMAFVWEGEDTMQITRVGRPGLNVNQLSGGFIVPQVVPEDRQHRFRWAFDLVRGYADEPATFTLGPTQASPDAVQDGSFLIWMRVKDPSKDVVYDQDEVESVQLFSQLRKPCTLEVGEDERSGSLDCPEVATEEGETVGYRITWRAVGPSKPF